MLGPEGLESIVDSYVPTEFVSSRPEQTTVAEEMHETRKSLLISRRDTGMPVGQTASRISQILDDSELSPDQRE